MGGVRGVTRGNSPADKGYGGKLSGKERLCGFPAPRRAGWEDRAVTLPRHHGNRTRPSSADITSETEVQNRRRQLNYRRDDLSHTYGEPSTFSCAKNAGNSLNRDGGNYPPCSGKVRAAASPPQLLNLAKLGDLSAATSLHSAIRHSSTLRTPSVAVRLPRVAGGMMPLTCGISGRNRPSLTDVAATGISKLRRQVQEPNYTRKMNGGTAQITITAEMAAERGSLNRDGARYRLPVNFDPVLTSHVPTALGEPFSSARVRTTPPTLVASRSNFSVHWPGNRRQNSTDNRPANQTSYSSHGERVGSVPHLSPLTLSRSDSCRTETRVFPYLSSLRGRLFPTFPSYDTPVGRGKACDCIAKYRRSASRYSITPRADPIRYKPSRAIISPQHLDQTCRKRSAGEDSGWQVFNPGAGEGWRGSAGTGRATAANITSTVRHQLNPESPALEPLVRHRAATSVPVCP
ncbi:hypothetical protein Bbelb_192610 [Branchiostoma belcheri]|nr:hypothetical protein Bbelb_192610 [Branchiostoma belcheri]